MKTLLKLPVLACLLVVAPHRGFADLMLMDITEPKHCPDGLTVKSKAKDGMIVFDVYVEAEKVAHAGELYKGRVGSHAFLQIANAEQKIAFVAVHGWTESKRTWYQFSVSPAAAKTSELQLGVNLFEKDGMQTIGGGVSMRIHLAGFEPKSEETGKAK